MYELNKTAFGSFLAQLRREKGMTQKELAACLLAHTQLHHLFQSK